jgi:hypothetical protein
MNWHGEKAEVHGFGSLGLACEPASVAGSCFSKNTLKASPFGKEGHSTLDQTIFDSSAARRRQRFPTAKNTARYADKALDRAHASPWSKPTLDFAVAAS